MRKQIYCLITIVCRLVNRVEIFYVARNGRAFTASFCSVA